MRSLTAPDIVHIWEVGASQHALDRAMTILRVAFPEAIREKLALLTIGQRDACLFAVREQAFGSRLSSLANCPACQEQVEFVLDLTDMPITVVIEPAEQIFTLEMDNDEVHFRLPNSRDLAAIAGSQHIAAARMILARRCIIAAHQHGAQLAIEEALSETLVSALEAQMELCDPLAAIDIPLDCSNCGHQWEAFFDIVSFFWAEIAAQARRLLREVHTLARYYGWREADILAMSATRRQFYLEMGA